MLESWKKNSVIERKGPPFRLFKSPDKWMNESSCIFRYAPDSQKAVCWRTRYNVEISNFKSFKSDWNRDLPVHPTKDRFADLTNQLISYLTLPNDWDGYEGAPPTKQTVYDGIRLLRLLPRHAPVPKPTLGNSGILGFYWEKKGLYAEICFEGNETFWYYAEDGINEIGEDVVSLNTKRLPDDLILFLKQF